VQVVSNMQLRQACHMYLALQQSMTVIPGVGPALAKRLAGAGMHCMGDLLLLLPKAYIDDRVSIPIRDMQEGVVARTSGRVLKVESTGRGKRRQIIIVLGDDSGAQIQLRFFHSPYLLRDARLVPGRQISVRGKSEWWRGSCQMVHPEWMPLEAFSGGWKPVYASVAGLTGMRIAGMIQRALPLLPRTAISSFDADLKEYPSFGQALRLIHAPNTDPDSNPVQQAMIRLRLEELLTYLYLMRNMRQKAQISAPEWPKTDIIETFLASLPYPLTEAQASVLAQQHAETLNELLAPLDRNVVLLTGGMRAQERRKILGGLTDGSIDMVVGTHALISEDVQYHKLGLAVVDEQHRFGVRQRWALTECGDAVHLLAMTATPIPRSLALALYGDMDLSLMCGMPPGRKPVETRVISGRGKLADGMRRMLDEGGRIYWIVPRIDEDEDGVSVDQRVEALKARFPDAGVLGLHGRMKPKEKSEALDAFTKGDCRLLVSTTVIEVGVNVPEARLMVIEQAEGYGLAQLHQLRGRVGRSNTQSYCVVLPSKDASEAALSRLSHMAVHHDGLELAELDLKLRGAGDALGARQSGEAGFRLLDIVRDAGLIRHWHEHLPPIEPTDAMVQFWRPVAESVD